MFTLEIKTLKGVFAWRRASPLGRASPLCQDPASQLNSVKICFRLYERRASPLWRDLTIDYPRSRLGELEIFHIKLRGLRTHDKGCLDQHFLDNISFHKLCLFMRRL